MTVLDDHGPLNFFKLLHRKFGIRLKPQKNEPQNNILSFDPRGFESQTREPQGLGPSSPDIISDVLKEAFETFELSVVNASDDLYTIACHGGCANCCTIRVAATAPEILLIARTIKAHGGDLASRIFEADALSNSLSEEERMVSALPCPLIEADLCAIYSVRPLACRGHASYDEMACTDALNGLPVDVPISALHMQVRSLVQNALQSAMRDAGMPWATYELNAALKIALLDDDAESAWVSGEDVFAAAMLTEVSLEEMSETFDAIKMAS